MTKHGPCYHCGVTSTPLWRNGPPDKPVLCNACGSRWRTKGSLTNYTPLHARAESDEFEDFKVAKGKTVIMSTKNKEPKILKRKYGSDNTEFGGIPYDYNNYNHGFRRSFDEDTSNRSSSGSAISNSESCAQYGNADASDLTGPFQPIVWDTTVPSKKRSCKIRLKPPSVDKLTKPLYTLWHEQQSSCLSNCSEEEELLLESGKSMVSVEIGHGSVLIRHPSSIAREEESEASSLSSTRAFEKVKKFSNPKIEQERIGRDKDQLEKLQILGHHNSPLCDIDLQDVLNCDTFMSRLTTDERQKLLKFVPPIDTPDSMFDSPQFKENLLSFQRLLADGVFDNSLSGVKKEDCRNLKKFILCSSTKSKWIEQYQILKDSKGKNCIQWSKIDELNSPETDRRHPKFSGIKATMKNPGRIPMKSIYDQKEPIDNENSLFSPKSQFSSPNGNNSSHYADECYGEDLLLDVPSNSSFPQAELLPVYPNLLVP